MSSHTHHAAWHSNRSAVVALPAYFQHPATGVTIEVDNEGVTTFYGNGKHGNFRSWSKMEVNGLRLWGPADEIAILRNHRWKRI